MRRAISRSLLALLGCSLMTVSSRGEEEEIPLDKVPAAVMKTVKEKFPKAEIKKAAKEVEDGKTAIELVLKNEGQDIDVALKEDGTILEIEKTIKVADLPKAVASSLKSKYPKATLKKAEEITEGKKTVYEVVVAVGEKSHEVVLSPEGKILEDQGTDKN